LKKGFFKGWGFCRVRLKDVQTNAVSPLMYMSCERNEKLKKKTKGSSKKKGGLRTKGETAVVCVCKKKGGTDIHGMCEYADARYIWAP